jgi:hypothetical protein
MMFCCRRPLVARATAVRIPGMACDVVLPGRRVLRQFQGLYGGPRQAAKTVMAMSPAMSKPPTQSPAHAETF